jgi:predicted lactoylglutathione lyase
MPTKIFVNTTVNDLKKSQAFFEALGWHFNPDFSDDSAACLVISDTIYAMLHTEASFRRFTSRPICDAKTSNEVLLAVSCESRNEVNSLVDKALAAGGTVFREPEDLGFMFLRSFQDLDGHVWEFFFMAQA